jgi:divalent metal cation (Fe/Co/Zn/Cd) transporter
LKPTTDRISVMAGEGEIARETQVRHAFRLEYFTVAWMVIEATVAITSGVIAHSIALIAFGLDSVIELFAAFVVIWQLRGVAEEQEAKEGIALRLIAVTFFAIAAYVSAEAIYDLVRGSRPEVSGAGITLAAAAMLVMPILSLMKRRLGRRLGNAALVADGAESMYCGVLAGVLLLGLALNAAFGWWWADGLAALVVAVFAIREGVEAWEGASGDEAAHSVNRDSGPVT